MKRKIDKTVTKHTALVFILIVIFSSCIDLQSNISLNNDGSGTLELEYEISRKTAHLGRLDENDPSIPLPVNRDDFERTVAVIDGMTLTSFSLEETDDFVRIAAVVTFSNVEQISRFLGNDTEEVIALNQSGGETVFQYTIYEKMDESIDEETLLMLETFFQGYELSFALTPPRQPKQLNRGEISDNGRIATYTVSLVDLFKNNETVVWNIIW